MSNGYMVIKMLASMSIIAIVHNNWVSLRFPNTMIKKL